MQNVKNQVNIEISLFVHARENRGTTPVAVPVGWAWPLPLTMVGTVF